MFWGACSRGSRRRSRTGLIPRARLALALAARSTSTKHLAPQPVPSLLLGWQQPWGLCSAAANLWHVRDVSQGCFLHLFSRGVRCQAGLLCAGAASGFEGQGSGVGLPQACIWWAHLGQPCLWLEPGLWGVGVKIHLAILGSFLGGNPHGGTCRQSWWH